MFLKKLGCVELEVFSNSQTHRNRGSNGGFQGLGVESNGEMLAKGYKILVMQDE